MMLAAALAGVLAGALTGSAGAGGPARLADLLVVAAAALVLVASRRLPSARIFLVASAAITWTAASLFFELPGRGGVTARLGWYGILVAGPLAVLLVVLALGRYGREHGTWRRERREPREPRERREP